MDEVSFGKARIILLPVLLGLIIIFFLRIFSIKISFWICVALLIAILIIAIIWVIFSRIPTQAPLGVSSRIKVINFDSVISTIMIAVVIILVVGISVLILIETDFGEGGMKISGDYIEKDGAIYIENGACVITKTIYYGKYPHATFDVKGNGTAEVVFRDCNPKFGFEDFHSGEIEFDTKGKIQKIIFKTDMNAISVRIGGDFTYLYAIDNAEKYRTREVILTITGKDIWLDNFKS